jgi:hypothetical protein
MVERDAPDNEKPHLPLLPKLAFRLRGSLSGREQHDRIPPPGLAGAGFADKPAKQGNRDQGAKPGKKNHKTGVQLPFLLQKHDEAQK